MKALVNPADLDLFASKFAAAIDAPREAHEAAVRKARAIDSAKLDKALDMLASARFDMETTLAERRELLGLARKTVASAKAAVAHFEAGSNGNAARRIYQ